MQAVAPEFQSQVPTYDGSYVCAYKPDTVEGGDRRESLGWMADNLVPSSMRDAAQRSKVENNRTGCLTSFSGITYPYRYVCTCTHTHTSQER